MGASGTAPFSGDYRSPRGLGVTPVLTPLDWAMYRRWVHCIVSFYAACVGGLWILAVVTKSEIPPRTAAAVSTVNEFRTDPAISRSASTSP